MWSAPSGYEVTDYHGQRIFRAVTAEYRDVRIPEDFLARHVLPLDLEDEVALLGFVNEFGVLGVWHEGYRALGPYRPTLELPPGTTESRRIVEDMQARDDAGEGLPALDDDAAWAAVTFFPADEFLDEFRLGAAMLQALTRCRIELEQGRFNPRRLAARWPTHAPFPSPSDRGQARARLFAGVREALATLPVTLFPADEHRPDLVKPTREWQEVTFALRRVRSLYVVGCIDLANHITSARLFRVCANERCYLPERLFTLQEGPKGWERPDLVKYCSRECRGAQIQREYRRNKARRKQASRTMKGHATRKGGQSTPKKGDADG